MPVEPVQHHDPQMRREAGKFRGPVRHQAGRHDDQRRPIEAPGLFLDNDMGDGLRRLAKAHVVGQQSAEVFLPQMLQPVDALLLVRPQAGDEVGRHRRQRNIRDRPEARDMGGDGSAILPAGRDQFLQIQHAGAPRRPPAPGSRRCCGRPHSIKSSITASSRAMRSDGSFRMRPSSRLVTISPSMIRAPPIPPRSRRRIRMGSRGWRTPSISMPKSSEKAPSGASAT